MQSSRRLHFSLGVLVSAAALSLALTASPAPPGATTIGAASPSASEGAAAAPSASESAAATPTGAASAGAAPSGSAAAAAAVLPLLKGADIPAEPSDAPKNKEWDAGKKVRPYREEGGPCTFTLLREWLRIECANRIGATLAAGDPADVKILAGGSVWAWVDSSRPALRTFITLRLRRGESKLLSLLKTTSLGYGGVVMTDAENLAVVWREGREDPMILVEKTTTP